MPLLAVLDETAFSGLPEATVLGKDSFVKNEKDNAYYLNLPGEEAGKLAIPLQKEVDRLKTHNTTVLGEKDALQAKYRPFEALGKTPEEIKTFLESNTPEDIKTLNTQFSLKEDAYRQQVESAKQSAQDSIKQSEEAKTEAFGQLKEYIKRTTVAELKTKFDLNNLADDVLGNRIVVVPEAEGSNKFVTRVIENGEIAYKAGSFKTPEQLVEELRNDKGFSGMVNAGTGGGMGATGRQQVFSGGSIRVSRSESKTNPRLYQEAKAQAEKTGAAIEFID